MNSVHRPEMTIAMMIAFLASGGKLTARLAEDQFSRKIEHAKRTGIERRLL